MLTLTYTGTTSIPVEAECITPDNLVGKSLDEIAQLPVQHGNQAARVGDFFQVSGDPSDETVVVEGDTTRVKWLGTGMKRGRLTVTGNAGMHVGSEMRGGELHVLGNASDWAGGEMRGGLLHIRGSAGHLAGAAYRGSRVGMRGGLLLIQGSAGNEVGAGLRRGLIAVGDVGDYVGVGVVAGSIFVFGKPGVRPGAGMKRGSIVFAGPAPDVLPTFKLACVFQPVFLALYLRRLKELGYPVPPELASASWRRYCGDLVSLGKGELLIREP
ncbi:MAG: formylmethanofuran dehydrogenase subunit C [Gemmataceae bacterium]